MQTFVSTEDRQTLDKILARIREDLDVAEYIAKGGALGALGVPPPSPLDQNALAHALDRVASASWTLDQLLDHPGLGSPSDVSGREFADILFTEVKELRTAALEASRLLHGEPTEATDG